MADFIESEAEESEVNFCTTGNWHSINFGDFQEEEELEPHERKKLKRAKAVEDSSEEEEGQLDKFARFASGF